MKPITSAMRGSCRVPNWILKCDVIEPTSVIHIENEVLSECVTQILRLYEKMINEVTPALTTLPTHDGSNSRIIAVLVETAVYNAIAKLDINKTYSILQSVYGDSTIDDLNSDDDHDNIEASHMVDYMFNNFDGVCQLLYPYAFNIAKSVLHSLMNAVDGLTEIGFNLDWVQLLRSSTNKNTIEVKLYTSINVNFSIT